ncbi:hypothetical protein yc1106_09212 [Curvularia clavata]|uniref:Uncharacterized protein n=1 Tax=Curvularia clavata TaxID=95742 RepID=A0A9Q9DVA8_CURCL|nr:hypothetical protein yc1106_09212 [Curvularia clavata]
MPRPCQRRRASAIANRKSKSTKPEGPPPIRHKARQKAIHNARRGRGGGRGGRGGRGGGRGGQSQNGGDRFAKGREVREELDFIPLSGGNNFEALHRARLDEYTQSSEGEISTDSDSDSDSYGGSETDSDELGDEDMEDTEDISINIEESLPTNTKRKPPRPTVMFTIPAAMAVYKKMYQSRFPLTVLMHRTHYGLFIEDTSPDSGTYISVASSAVSRRSSVSSAPSEEIVAVEESAVLDLEAQNAARDYVFDWGVHSGKRFTEVSDQYLRTIGGQMYKYAKKHPGLLEAFEYHMPGCARLERKYHKGRLKSQPGETKAKKPAQQAPPQSQPAGTKEKKPTQQAPQPSPQNPSQKGKYRSHKRKREKKRQQP